MSGLLLRASTLRSDVALTFICGASRATNNRPRRRRIVAQGPAGVQGEPDGVERCLGARPSLLAGDGKGILKTSGYLPGTHHAVNIFLPPCNEGNIDESSGTSSDLVVDTASRPHYNTPAHAVCGGEQQYYVYLNSNTITGSWQPYVKNYAPNHSFDYGGRAAALWLER